MKKNGFGAVDEERLDKSIDQIALTYKFKNAKPKGSDIFDASFLPPAASGRRSEHQLSEPPLSDPATAFVSLEGVSHAYGARRLTVSATSTAAPAARSRSMASRSA